MTQVSGNARPLAMMLGALALMLGAAAMTSGAAAQTASGADDDARRASSTSWWRATARSSGAATARSGWRRTAASTAPAGPRSPKALGFGASPTDPYRDRPSRPGLIYDEVLQSFRAPFEPDR